MRIIAFSGRARVGKSHITAALSRQLWDNGYVPVVLPLAAPLKVAAAEAGFPKDTHPNEYRAFCQTEGAIARDLDQDHWLKLWHDMYLDKMMNELGSDAEYVVIVDDVRYANELQLISKMTNSKTIFVDEGSRSGTLEDDDAAWRDHHSEYLANEAHADWDSHGEDYDFRIINDGEVYEDLVSYITAGDDCGKVIEAWLGNHDCDCFLCEAFIQNDPQIVTDAEATDRMLDAVKANLDADDDLEAINRALGSILGMEVDFLDDDDEAVSDIQAIDEMVQDYLEELDDLEEEEDDDDIDNQ